MKHKITRPAAAVVLAGVLLIGGAMAVLSEGDSLISLSYLKQTIMPKVVSKGTAAEQKALNAAYDKALAALEKADKETVAGFAGGLHSEDLRSRDYQRDDQVKLKTGSGVLMLDGAAAISHDGAVIDITQGKTVSSGSTLKKGHRYLVAEDTQAVVTGTSGLVKLGVQGTYNLKESQQKAAPFLDVLKSDWFCESVDYVYFNKLFSGIGYNLFDPNSNMTRAMMATVLYNMAGSPENELKAAPAVFKDVTSGAWYYSYVNWAAAQGVANGVGGGIFAPEEPVTREQVMKLLYNFGTKYLGLKLTERTDITGCADYRLVSTWSRKECSWAVGAGICVLDWDKKINPTNTATRAEVAAMLMRFNEKYL